jgi:hypothetical protein
MSRRPAFLRESMWRLLEESERAAIHDVVVQSREASARLVKAQEDVATHRRLARKFADQARSLLETMRERPDSHGSPPSVVRRVEALADDLAATAGSAQPRTMKPVISPDPPSPRVAAYSPPVEQPVEGPAAMDDEERDATQVGASPRTRSQLSREPTLRPDTVTSYDGDLEIIDPD